MERSESASQAISTDITIADAMIAFRSGNLTSVDLVKACLERANNDKELNIFVTLDDEGAIEAARNADKQRKDGDRKSVV